MLSMTVLLVLKLTIPLSRRPLVTVLTNSSLVSVLRLLIRDGPTMPSWLAPWQRSQAAARQVRKPVIVNWSTLYPSTTLYGVSVPGVGACAATLAAARGNASRRARAMWDFMGS